jgi:hypothetical protein
MEFYRGETARIKILAAATIYGVDF